MLSPPRLSTVDELAALVAKRRIEAGTPVSTETTRLGEVLPLVLRQIGLRQMQVPPPVQENATSGEKVSRQPVVQSAGMPVGCGGFPCSCDGAATMRV